MDDETCLKLIQQGGQKAQQGVGHLYRRYKADLAGYLMHHFRFTPEVAQDVVHDAFVNIVRYVTERHNKDEEIAIRSVRAWIWKITINRARDIVGGAEYRSRALEASSTEDEETSMQHERVPGDEPDPGLVDCVRRAWRAFTA